MSLVVAVAQLLICRLIVQVVFDRFQLSDMRVDQDLAWLCEVGNGRAIRMLPLLGVPPLRRARMVES